MDGLNFYITDNLTEQDLEKKSRLQPVIEKARDENRKVTFIDGTLLIDRKAYKGVIPPKQDRQDRRDNRRPTLIGRRFSERNRQSQASTASPRGEFTFTLPDNQAQ